MRHGRRKPAVETHETRIRVALSVAVALTFTASMAGRSNWMWGMNVFRYSPTVLSVFLAAVGLAGIWLLPPLNDDSVRRRLARAGVGKVSLLSAAAAGCLFFLFRARTYLLGDGLEILRRLHQGEVPAPRSPLFNALEPAIYRAGLQVGAGQELAAAVLPIACGTIAVGVALFFFLRTAVRIGAGGVTIAALFLLTGTMQLFFGYVETYALLAAAVLIFHAAAFDALSCPSDRERRPALLVAIPALLLGIVAHPFAVAFIPGGVLLVCLGTTEGIVAVERRRLLRFGLAALAVPVLGAALFMINPSWREAGSGWRFLAPQEYLSVLSARIVGLNTPHPWAERYRVLSLVHLADLGNSLWIAGAAAFLFAVGAVSRRALLQPAGWFGVSGFLAMLAVRFMWRTPLGAIRDWDLFSGLGFAAAGLAAACVLGGAGRRLALPAVAAGLVLLIPWIGIQASPGASARRHIDGIEAEPRPEPFVEAGFHNAMGDRFTRIMEFDLAARAYERALSVYPRYEFAWRLGVVNIARNRLAEAATAFTRALDLRPDDAPAMLELATALIGSGEVDRARGILDRALELHPDNAGAWLRRARTEFVAGRMDEGRRYLSEAEKRAAPDSPDLRDIDELNDWLRGTAPAAGP